MRDLRAIEVEQLAQGHIAKDRARTQLCLRMAGQYSRQPPKTIRIFIYLTSTTLIYFCSSLNFLRKRGTKVRMFKVNTNFDLDIAQQIHHYLVLSFHPQ